MARIDGHRCGALRSQGSGGAAPAWAAAQALPLEQAGADALADARTAPAAA